jgi:hypothetical protein
MRMVGALAEPESAGKKLEPRELELLVLAEAGAPVVSEAGRSRCAE